MWLGVSDRTVDESEVTYAQVAEVIIHPKYDRKNYWSEFDVAIIKLNETIIMSDTIRPICLPSTLEDFTMAQPEQTGKVAAWGLYNAAQESSMHVMHGDFPIVTNQHCFTTYQETSEELGAPLNPKLLITENMFCAGVKNGNQGTCRGDSGTPFVTENSATSVYYEMGLVSFGVSECGTTVSYTAFTKLNENIIRWIMEKTNNLMEE